jgi:predicted DNA-binding transcriptional regulator YafY
MAIISASLLEGLMANTKSYAQEGPTKYFTNRLVIPKRPKANGKAKADTKKKFSKMLAILNKLNCKDCFTAPTLAEDFGMQTRTINRYLKELRDAGFPISFDPEKKTYMFEEGYCLQRLNFSTEEVLALALAKRMLCGMENTITKIEKKVESTVLLPEHIVIRQGLYKPEVEKLFIQINEAIYEHFLLDIKYHALYSGEHTCRIVEPYYLYLSEGIWLLRAYCRLRKKMLFFALDQIESLTVTDKPFMPKVTHATRELVGAFGSMVDGDPVEVVLRFNPVYKAYIQRQKWHESQKEKLLSDGSLEVRYTVNGLDGIKPWIYRWLPNVTVKEPEELRTLMKEDLTQSLNNLNA